MLKVERNIIFGKAGGNSGKNTHNYKVALPAAAVEALGATIEDKAVILEIEEGKVTIRKAK